MPRRTRQTNNEDPEKPDWSTVMKYERVACMLSEGLYLGMADQPSIDGDDLLTKGSMIRIVPEGVDPDTAFADDFWYGLVVAVGAKDTKVYRPVFLV